ncbi:hypothetical protein B1L04_05340 [Microcystis aeruginosa KW]|uniref:T6SS Phospholipase effector Tle1-like catalytic domain-containing protein n=1 Tax=Microcystis aeruginosa KW TaxID=1960155 RepID=A0A1V4BWK3_MICAE|nr:DUF2235 domain-containing protein [Microcystis aeruginosa]OPF18861.1 hypothetical protein B1L04_05340 [Microcystis aeruginosa KW]
MKSRLIVCCDGTWQDLGQGYPTNVVKMAQAITPLDDSKGNPIRQIIYYDEGIGTKQTNAEVTDTLIKIAGGALGIGMDHKIEDAYRFLCLNYQPEDEIYRNISINAGKEAEVNLENEPALVRKHRLRLH